MITIFKFMILVIILLLVILTNIHDKMEIDTTTNYSHVKTELNNKLVIISNNFQEKAENLTTTLKN